MNYEKKRRQQSAREKSAHIRGFLQGQSETLRRLVDAGFVLPLNYQLTPKTIEALKKEYPEKYRDE